MNYLNKEEMVKNEKINSSENNTNKILFENFKFFHNTHIHLQELKQIKNKLSFIIFCRNEISNLIFLKMSSKS